MPTWRRFARTRSINVVFPAPDGPETMNSVPSEWKLLDILYLLADPLHLRLQFYDKGADGRGARLRAHGVDLTDGLLRQEVELLSRRLLSRNGFLDLVEMMREPG